jgi:AraC-like DNA-binding protein
VVSVLEKGVFSVGETLEHIEDALDRSREMGTEARRMARRAMAYMHEHYGEPISRQDVASYVGLSERHLTRCFRREAGVPPMTYLNRYRVRRAKALLERGDRTVTEVAMEVGFSSGSYFSRVFGQEVGVSPSAYQMGERPSLTLPDKS